MLVSSPQQLSLTQVAVMAQEAKYRIAQIYLHWTAGRYGQVYDDYHLNIDADGTIYCTCSSLTEQKSHTWKRNRSSAAGWLRPLQRRRRNTLGSVVYARFTRRRSAALRRTGTAGQSLVVLQPP